MLQSIYIKNFTIIDQLDVDFENGLSVITGETGAGKSIMIDALSLTLGNRAQGKVVREGASRAEIVASFDTSALPSAQAWLNDNELDDGTQCILRRIISMDNKSKASINGTPVPLNLIRELSDHLIKIHGQQSQLHLKDQSKQLALLDRFSGHKALLQKTAVNFDAWHKADSELKKLISAKQNQDERISFLRFQLDELNSLNLEDDEFLRLEAEFKLLSNSEELITSANHAIGQLGEDETNALSQLHSVNASLTRLSENAPNLKAPLELTLAASIEIEEALAGIKSFLESSELNPERHAEVEQRLMQIHDIARKHRVTPELLFDHINTLQSEYDQLIALDANTLALEAEVQKLTEAHQTSANELSASRKKAAQKLAKSVTTSIQELNLPHADLTIQIEQTDHFNALGMDKIEFLISTNPGVTPAPLAQVASGGELSRISLALEVISTDSSQNLTLIFDEVDTGISGQTAAVVGKLLGSLGQTNQVLCVTHLPQVASFGHHHFNVSKVTDGKVTTTELKCLDDVRKIDEIARMLGGMKITEKSKGAAKELLEASMV